MAVTRAGIPVRVWCWPGNTTDSALIRQAREDMRDWTLARVMWVADRGFSARPNRRELRRGGGHYIIGEKLRSGSAEATAALSRQGRYQHVRDNLQVKEVRIADDERFVICYNPEQAERDAALREIMTGKLTTLIADTDRLTVTKRAELRGRISTMPGLNRFLRVTPGGLLRIDKKKIASEANLDGKYLLRCSDPHLSAEDIALGYKQLLQVERGWRDMKTTLELRPVYHRLEDRIRAHVILCWLALLLVRIVETTTGDTWARLREDLQELHIGTFEGPAGTFRQRTELTTAQRDVLAKLRIDPPKKIIELGPPPRRPDQHKPHRLDTRLSGGFKRSRRSNPQIPCPAPTSAAEPGAKAAQMMARHGVDEAMLAATGVKQDALGERRIAVTDPYSQEKAQLAGLIGRALGCRAVRHPGYGRGQILAVTIFGYESDLRRTEVLFTSLLLQATRQVVHQRPTACTGESTAAFRRTWLTGFASEVYRRLTAAERAATDQHDAAEVTRGPSAALVLADRRTVVK